MINKRVFFVGGAQYSGTTLLDIILSNDDRGFSCGEVSALFNPYRNHHSNPECGCANSRCDIWRQIKKNGQKYLYLSIFERFPQIDFIVDSSKDVLWIASQMKNLKKQNITVENLLIWKTPQEIASSFRKRGQLDNWERCWTNYYRLYFTLIDQWASVKYADLINVKGTLQNVCDNLKIDYYPEKLAYWKRQYHTLFGNSTAKIHLYEKNDPAFKSASDELIAKTNITRDIIENRPKSVYYDECLIDNLPIQSIEIVNSIQRILELSQICNSNSKKVNPTLLRAASFNNIELGLRYIKYNSQNLINKTLN